ncbi:MAG: hypothetical protein HY366_01320, partial [Candidatus Aenigmarchaeota archaeon]|nr:hypothetical protein [Candidatus Aenigmarchaeota archaeon]
ELAELLNAVNDAHGTSYHATFFSDTGIFLNRENPFENAGVIARDVQGVEKRGHELRTRMPPMARRQGCGRVTVQGFVENAGRPVMVWAKDHAVLVVGYSADGKPLVHDPLVGEYMPGGTKLHEAPPTDIILIQNIPKTTASFQET